MPHARHQMHSQHRSKKLTKFAPLWRFTRAKGSGISRILIPPRSSCKAGRRHPNPAMPPVPRIVSLFLQPSRHAGPEGKPTNLCLYVKWVCDIAKVSWDTWNQHHIHTLLCQIYLLVETALVRIPKRTGMKYLCHVPFIYPALVPSVCGEVTSSACGERCRC